jgi:hypothetical protein
VSVTGAAVGRLATRRLSSADGGPAPGTDTGEFEGVFDIGEAGAQGKTFGPALHDLGVYRSAAQAAAADEVVAVPGSTSMPVQSPTAPIAYDVNTSGPLQFVERAVDRAQADPDADSQQSRV